MTEEEIRGKMDDAGFGDIKILDPVEVGDLTAVKESKPLIPATRAVQVRIKRVSARTSKDNKKSWRWINLGCQIVDGIGDEGKWKNSYINSTNIAYYAHPDKYPQFRTDKSYLGQLASLQRATGTLGKRIDNEFTESLKEMVVMIDIIQKYNDYTNQNENVAVRFRGIPAEAQV